VGYDKWVTETRSTFTYNANGTILSYLYERWSYGPLHIIVSLYTYDANGNILSELTEDRYNGQLYSSSRRIYTYDAAGNNLSELYEEWRNGQWTNSWRRTYTYDANKNMIFASFEQWNNSLWVESNAGYYIIPNKNSSYVVGYRIKASYHQLGITDVSPILSHIVSDYSLSQNYPNPFNPSTILSYSVPERSKVRLSIFNTLGQKISEIIDGTKDAGYYKHSFNASQLSSGIYFYRIEAVSEQNSGKTFVSMKKMVLLK
jgi:hypothetical protein